MRSGTHFTQQNVFLLFTVVVTKHVWPYFQSRFPKTSSERVSSCKVKAAAMMTRQPRLRRISMLALFIRSFVRSIVRSFVRSFICSFVRSFIRSFFNARDPLFWVANFWLCWEILGASKIDGRQKLKICVVLRYIRRKFDRQTNWLFFAKRSQGHSTEKPTWFDQTSMVKTYDVKIL